MIGSSSQLDIEHMFYKCLAFCIKLPLDKIKTPCYTIAKFRKRGKIMKVFGKPGSLLQDESEETIERFYRKLDEKRMKAIAQAKAVKHAQSILSNNDNQKEVKHGYYNYFQS